MNTISRSLLAAALAIAAGCTSDLESDSVFMDFNKVEKEQKQLREDAKRDERIAREETARTRTLEERKRELTDQERVARETLADLQAEVAAISTRPGATTEVAELRRRLDDARAAEDRLTPIREGATDSELAAAQAERDMLKRRVADLRAQVEKVKEMVERE